MITKLIKPGLLLIMAFLIGMTFLFDVVAASPKVVFENPPNATTIFTKRTREVITGYITEDPRNITRAEISFDGQIWRPLEPVAGFSDNYYHFSYSWEVAGKGRNFITVNAYNEDELVVEGRILLEVYVPPELQEKGLSELLTEYQKLQEEKQNKEALDTTAGTYLALEQYLENNFGTFLVDNYDVLLPTNKQYELSILSFYYFEQLVNKYPLGLDILRIITIPYLALVTLLVTYFILIDHLNEIGEYFSSAVWRLTKKCRNGRLTGILFDPVSLITVSRAKIVFTNRDNQSEKYITFSDETGGFCVTQMNPGDFSFEIYKHGYKHYFDDEIDLNEYLGHTVKASFVTIGRESARAAIPAWGLIDRQRVVNYEKSNILFGLKTWVIRNVFSLIFISFILIATWVFFEGNGIIWYATGILAVSYLVFLLVIRPTRSWGTVIDDYGQIACLKRIELVGYMGTAANTWTDHFGKYRFDHVPNGRYKLDVTGNKKIDQEDDQFYNGQEFDYQPNEKQVKKDIKLKQK